MKLKNSLKTKFKKHFLKKVNFLGKTSLGFEIFEKFSKETEIFENYPKEIEIFE